MGWGKVAGNHRPIGDHESCANEWNADTMFENCPPERRVLPVFAGRGNAWRDDDAGWRGNKQAQFS